jgi:tRNA/rRNA methyltransferase
MGLTEQDVRTLWGMVVRLVEGPRRDPKKPNRRKQADATASDDAQDQ